MRVLLRHLFCVAIILTAFNCADSSSKRGCGTDSLSTYTGLAELAGKQVVTVAVAQYGLLRNNCSTYNYERLFAQLTLSEKYVYVIDHFIHSNEIFAGHETGKVRKKVAGGNPNNAHIDLFIFEDYPECRFATTPQELVDMKIEPTLAQTCGKRGDAWGDRSCGVTKNYLRALYSQKRVKETIVAHEHARKRKYDIVVLMRPDVLFTRQLNLKYFEETADGLFGRPRAHRTFSPDWATFYGFNDRFLMGARDGVMHAMARLDYAVTYCDKFKVNLHAEKFMRWVVQNYSKWANLDMKNEDGTAYRFENQLVHSFYFRRLRANAGLVAQQYLKKGEARLPIDTIGTCSKAHVAEEVEGWTPIVDSTNVDSTIVDSADSASVTDAFKGAVWNAAEKRWDRIGA